jgi:hypothetical protein
VHVIDEADQTVRVLNMDQDGAVFNTAEPNL